MWIVHTHMLTHPNTYDRVRDHYVKHIEQGTMLTEYDVRDWIARTFEGEKTFKDTFEFNISPALVEQCMVQSSMDAHYEDMKAGPEVRVLAIRTRKRPKCIICLESKKKMVKILPCKCIFHRECIESALRWSPNCPICQTSVHTMLTAERIIRL